MSITIAADPVLAHLGPFAIRWYSLAIMLGIAVALYVSAREARRRGLDPDIILSLAWWAIPGGIIGARLLHVVDRFDAYRRDPLQILLIQRGGLAVFGAVLGGALAAWLFTRRRRLPFAALADTVAPGLVLAQAIGRIGCVFNGDAWGAPTTVPWAFVYTNPAAYIPRDLLGVPTHPYPLYDMALNLAIFAVLWRLRGRAWPAGAYFLTYLALYAASRFALTFVRQERVWFWGLQEAQVIALLTLAGALLLLLRLGWRRRATPRVLGGAGVA